MVSNAPISATMPAHVARPGWVMLLTAIAAFASIGLFGLMPWYSLALQQQQDAEQRRAEAETAGAHRRQHKGAHRPQQQRAQRIAHHE